MARFFVSDVYEVGQRATIKGEDSYHIQRVLRLKPDDIVTLCDGMGNDYTAAIESLTGDTATFKILEKYSSKGEPITRVTLYQGLPKATKMDLIIQKTVELGIHSIVPLITERAVVKLTTDKDIIKKQERWQRISEEAAKQCGRGIVPAVHMPMTFKEAVVQDRDKPLKLLLWEDERDISIRSILDKHNKGSNISILIGPEGGLSGTEVALAKEKGWISVSVGPRILRTETAGLAVLSAIMYRMEEMQWK